MRIGLCGTGGFAREVDPLAVIQAGADQVCVTSCLGPASQP